METPKLSTSSTQLHQSSITQTQSSSSYCSTPILRTKKAATTRTVTQFTTSALIIQMRLGTLTEMTNQCHSKNAGTISSWCSRTPNALETTTTSRNTTLS